MSTYCDQIQESLFNQYVLETLSGLLLIEIERSQMEDEKLMNEITELLTPHREVETPCIEVESKFKRGLNLEVS